MSLEHEALPLGLRAAWCGEDKGVRLTGMRYLSAEQAVAVVVLSGLWTDAEKARDAVRAWRARWP